MVDKSSSPLPPSALLDMASSWRTEALRADDGEREPLHKSRDESELRREHVGRAMLAAVDGCAQGKGALYVDILDKSIP